MKFFNWLSRDKPEILPMNFCDGKSNEDLLKVLDGHISVGSGNRIVLEILTRLCASERKTR